MRININQIKQIDWVGLAKKNRYSLVSVLILVGYFYAVFWAVSFVVVGVRDAFSLDPETAARQVVTFDLKSYEKVARRIGK
ncbi:MAG: hypothetical protein UW55_C0043G0010 [Candidatus Giovannonibacteria bacterium GW2011_GWA2_44_26]|uniref:Uncharacterized protein n=1 Tax=Candidatus Giovannonibacteria bacterium GW2011_GWA2_44_26 TaxID=1618648 RepID=A0A0G1IN80_9BACT|nr:MAG: hypothetical protein UW55_C0043G0010 [Candidatus Giovannonibacteria bacterium GW2011_GWA2_44_26]